MTARCPQDRRLYTVDTLSKNMKGAKRHNKRELMVIRRTIESVFSVLEYYGIKNILARSVDGFQQTVEIIVLTYNISYILQRYGFSFFN